MNGKKINRDFIKGGRGGGATILWSDFILLISDGFPVYKLEITQVDVNYKLKQAK